ncbi:hypothetical protein Tco_0808331 [Tanacetum coccineum]
MNLDDYEEPRVFVTCRSRLGRQIKLLGDETDIVSLYYHLVDNFQIQFGREEFCLVTGLRFEVEYWADYNNEDDPIPFRRLVFSSAKDGNLQFVLLGLEDTRGVPDWILRTDHVGQHYGISNLSGFQSMQGVPSSFPTTNSYFFEGAQATPSYGHNMATPNWQTPMPSHPDTSNWQSQMPSHSATLNWKPPISSYPHDAGLLNPIYIDELYGSQINFATTSSSLSVMPGSLQPGTGNQRWLP